MSLQIYQRVVEDVSEVAKMMNRGVANRVREFMADILS